VRSSNEPNPGRTVIVVGSPDGTEYRVVTAMKGVPLGTGPGGGLLSILLEALGEALIGADSPERKVAVFKVRRGYEPRYLKAGAANPVAAGQLVSEIAGEIERGHLRWTP
jgi:hypothetical protein